ncbi:MAG: hypothetical protein QM305_14390 [Bacteroidota bacterium]|jgi:hypothetical protein|nr:hypothetical protein [Bacteroidota bacterium]
MKYKYLRISAMGVLLALCFYSCIQEGIISKVNNESDLVVLELEGITFSFAFPGQDSHVVDTRSLQDNPEWAIDQLWLYEFDVNGILIAAPVNIREESTFFSTGVEASYTYKKKWDYGEQRRFFFVANMDAIAVTVGTTTLAELKAKSDAMQEMATASTDILYSKKTNIGGPDIPVTDDNDWRIPMTGMANNGNIISIIGGINVQVQLVRSVARIDVINRLPGFKITKLELFNSFKASYLHNDWETPNYLDATNRLATSVASFAEIGADGVTGAREGVPIKKAFYLYEGANVGANDDDITYVKITADYVSKTDEEYIIPFKQKNAGTGKFDTPVDVKRNHLYTIIIGSAYPTGTTNVKATLVNEPWTVFNMWEKFSFYNVKSHSGADALTEIAYNIVELTVPAGGGAVSIEFDTDYLKTNNIEVSQAVPASDDWLTNVQITPSGTKDFTVTFNVAANTGAVRNTLFKVKESSLSNDDDALTISVKQNGN